MISITQHPIWPELLPYVRIEVYDRDGGTLARHRVEIITPKNGDLLRKFLAVEMPCTVCGRTIHPIRTRAGLSHLYFAATCDLRTGYSCSRSRGARDEYRAVRAAVEKHDRDVQPLLF